MMQAEKTDWTLPFARALEWPVANPMMEHLFHLGVIMEILLQKECESTQDGVLTPEMPKSIRTHQNLNSGCFAVPLNT
jgi:hypothetical protein